MGGDGTRFRKRRWLGMAARRTRKEIRWRRVLRSSNELARRIERSAVVRDSRKPERAVLYLSLVRIRRCGELIYALRPEHATEARVLLRSMLELWASVQWILLRKSHQRASRFLKYEPVAWVRHLELVPAHLRPQNYAGMVRGAKRARRRVRHLFLQREAKGRLRWAKSWTKQSVEARLREVTSAQRAAGPGRRSTAGDVYFHYAWFSDTVHGGIFALRETAYMTRLGLRVGNPSAREAELLASSTAAFVRDFIEFSVKTFRLPFGAELQRLTDRINAGARE